MGLFDIFKGNAGVKASTDMKMSKASMEAEYGAGYNTSLLSKVNTYDLHSPTQSLNAFKQAVTMAKDVENPNRFNLLEYYTDASEQDGHLINLMSQRVLRVTGMPYNLYTKNSKGPENSLNEIASTMWFNKILTLVMEASFWGNSLIEVQKTTEGVKTFLVPRQNTIPEFQKIKENANSSDGEAYDEGVYANNLIDVNAQDDSRDLGMLLPLSYLAISKKQAALNWGEFIETYMQPVATATTDAQDPNEIQGIAKWLQNLGRKKWMVKNSQTQLDFVEASGSANVGVYTDFIKMLNDEMSEIVLGANMLTSDGASYSQSEVHLEGSMLLTKADLKFVTAIMNDKVIPMLQGLGVIPKGKVAFAFEDNEVYSIEEKLKIDEFILANFDVDPAYFAERYNIKTELKPKATPNV